MAFAIGNGTANASTFQFSHGGWFPDGGEVLGTFSGKDVRGDNSEEPDGIISLAQGEVSFFEMSFQGSTTLSAFEHNYEDLDFLEYTLANPEMLEILSSNTSQEGVEKSYDGRFKIIQQRQDGQSDLTIITDASPLVRQIPEPHSLIGLTLFGLGVCLKSKRGLGKD